MFNKEHVMIDLETMSTASNAVVCSIGAVKFQPGHGITSEFYCTIDARTAKAAGLDFDPATLDWWKRQNKAALDELVKNTIPLKDALTKFSKWYGVGSKLTWGNGSAFDNVILRNAYKAVGMAPPWKYTDEVCYRTVKKMFPGTPLPEQTGTIHNALDDAKFQAVHLLAMLGE